MADGPKLQILFPTHPLAVDGIFQPFRYSLPPPRKRSVQLPGRQVPPHDRASHRTGVRALFGKLRQESISHRICVRVLLGKPAPCHRTYSHRLHGPVTFTGHLPYHLSLK